MPERNDELLREEVRGIFVLGVIGSLLALGRGLDVKVFFDTSLGDLTSGLIGFWAIYVVLMAMGVSDDIVRPSISEICKRAAKLYFLVGLAVLMTVPISVVAYDFLHDHGVLFTLPNAIMYLVAILVVVILLTFGLYRKGSLFS
jgi:hypothetical protein